MSQKGSKFTDISPYTFAQLCDLYKKFQIPNFQRAYAWKTKQIGEFYDSVYSNPEEYFIGNMVCLAPSSESENRLTIVDGQQRVTSLSLWLLAIRDEVLASEKVEDQAKLAVEKKINNYIIGTDLSLRLSPESDYLRLLPGKENLQEVYRKLVYSEIDWADRNYKRKFDKNQLIYIRNYLQFRSLISKDLGNLDRLEEMLNKVLASQCIAIVCSGENDIFNIFEGLNSKGLGLSVADLVKNAILRSARNLNIENKVELLWLEMEGLFETVDPALFPKFLRHQWISENGYISNVDLFDSIKNSKIREVIDDELITYTNSLLADAKFYIGVYSEKHDELLSGLEDDLVEHLKNFRLLNNSQVYELILAYHRKLNLDPDYKSRYFTESIKRLWSFSFRARFVSINPSDYERLFAEHCEVICKSKGSDLPNIDNEFYKQLSKLVASSEQFTENFISDLNYDSDKDLIYFVLNQMIARVDKHITPRDPNIEHIVPQKPKFSEWLFEQKDVKDFVHNIGNLTLLSSGNNNRAANRGIKYKCEHVYAKDKLEFNKELLDLPQKFTNDPTTAVQAARIVVQERAMKLAKIADKLFSV